MGGYNHNMVCTHAVAVLADCRKALIGTGCMGRFSPFSTRNYTFALVGAPFFALKAAFSQKECSLVIEP